MFWSHAAGEAGTGGMPFPVGFGAKVQFGDHLSVGLDFGVRLTFSDYLDGVSRIANPKSKDYYGFGNLTLSYCFGDY